jgi:hypothetical protein
MKFSLPRIPRSVMVVISVVALWSLAQLLTEGPQEALAGSSSDFTSLVYFDVSSSFVKSESGYGGPGSSGGTGDALLRILNAGNFEALPNGFLCANIFVFDDAQEIHECCSCPVSPNELLTLSTIANLTSNPLFASSSLSLGSIMVVGDGAPPTSCFGAQEAASGAFLGADGLRVWLNHTETMASNQPGFKPPFGFITSTSVEHAASVRLDLGEGLKLVSECNALVQASSAGITAGICNCGTGEDPKAGPVSDAPPIVSRSPFGLF